MNSAIISECGNYRYRLDRDVQSEGAVFAYFGINCSTADAELDDQTVRKWIGFTQRNGGSRFIVGNPFAYRTPHVKDLVEVTDPVGPDNYHYLVQIIEEADVLVPCWGSQGKVPTALRHYIDYLRHMLFMSGKPVLTFGFTKDGDPKHPLMLGYSTELIPWTPTK